MTDADIIQFWGEKSLVRWRSDVIAATGLPAEAKRFLVDVGLPCDVDWTMRFNTEGGRLPELADHPGYSIIGRDYVVPICLDEARDGRVVSFSGRGEEEFMNSNVHLFGEFLVLYQQYRL